MKMPKFKLKWCCFEGCEDWQNHMSPDNEYGCYHRKRCKEFREDSRTMPFQTAEPELQGEFWHCGNCDGYVFESNAFCPQCGVRIIWPIEKEEVLG